MKQKIFTFLLIAATGLTACKKNGIDPDIKEYDETQIQNYISANSITGLSRDTTGGDTSGMYYKIINGGNGVPLEYSDRISFVYTLRTFDGKYVSTDTITNHFDDYLGHIAQDNLPKGLQTAIHNLLKYRDASMRVLIPSHLAYGTNGYGTGSVENTNNRIAGNQCLDYYVHVIDDQQVYDDMVIQNYMKANSLSGYTKTNTGLYYKVLVPGTGAEGIITDLSTITTTYTGTYLNNVVFDDASKTEAASFSPADLVAGVREGLENYATEGTSISLLVPSRLGYGITGTVPVHSCLRFEFQITEVTNQ
ncbi:FKBP-type peptidyl-prolyl cis-trans isomerase [Mucilaginibacter segetis]|uniref:Peptidyl-prolyl cis-trans isomerase n=1 Tax=Mucilaginibacter segetis TaxID=2793071 RepID=A0A934UN75_9SPHI|nr:FKBP-type peptidyl-prolyl cis-trans isomerase [Mucilaginibacter segetis]MBK0380498.1 hypothetical protein [Mucilaginibacter segetis]